MSTNELVKAGAASDADPRTVFVIYGRNRDARQEVFTFLRTIGLRPLEWDQAVELTGQGSPYVGDVLTAGLKAAQAIIVLQTPDDVVYLDGDFCDPNDPNDPEGEPQGQPRPNVFFEAGMAMGVSPDRTVIVEFGPIKKFSDISGRNVVRLDDTITRRQALANRLRIAGCEVDLTGDDWHRAGDLTPPKGPGKGRPLGKRLPKTERPRVPRLDGRLVDRGGSKIPLIEITNYGPGDALELDIVDLPNDGRGELRKYGENFPFPRLPVNKSINVLEYVGGTTWGSGTVSALTIKAAAKTEDGEPFEADIFVSLGSR
ncbi:TIR domain-containing protein [Nocardia cyriacigeorgica]|uniref:TIR domain-containing protein n=1 Tax=Nocardia cyriacigeorgica TaxID=135487 RepID=UPI0018950FEB|nr:nucleotide-binding protein [Nocardia cyriacigeorgica]MBF6087191.1 nucleotide-binding protein [Nocardia cyriacigeorgica]